MIMLKIKSAYYLNRYKFRHWFFKWNQDEEGDIVFSVAGVIHFVKYKEHTIVKFGKFGYTEAPKYVGGA